VDDGGGVVGVVGVAGVVPGVQDRVGVAVGSGVVDREAPVFVVAAVLDAAERDSFVAVVALAGPGVRGAERPASADGDFLQVRAR
jgi:hypothetical protein